jgi:hypothetical protein
MLKNCVSNKINPHLKILNEDSKNTLLIKRHSTNAINKSFNLGNFCLILFEMRIKI